MPHGTPLHHGRGAAGGVGLRTMKKEYMKPELLVAAMENEPLLLGGSPVQQVQSGTTGITLGGGSSKNGNVGARTKGRGLWDDEEDWDE